jgi:hypothetical protein
MTDTCKTRQTFIAVWKYVTFSPGYLAVKCLGAASFTLVNMKADILQSSQKMIIAI